MTHLLVLFQAWMGHRAALAKIPAYKMRLSTCVSTGSCVCVVVVMVAIGRFLLWLIFVHNYNHQNSDLMFCFDIFYVHCIQSFAKN